MVKGVVRLSEERKGWEGKGCCGKGRERIGWVGKGMEVKER